MIISAFLKHRSDVRALSDQIENLAHVSSAPDSVRPKKLRGLRDDNARGSERIHNINAEPFN
jgi:hypothetical protein